jgi:uncharacterized damage-inducible protein DinB
MDQNQYFPAIRQLAEYEIWCNAKALEAAAALETPQLFQQFPFGLGTIHRTLSHTVDIFYYWGSYVPPTIIKPSYRDYDPKATLQDIADLNAECSAKLMAAIDASDAAGLLHLDRRIHQVFHLVTHGTHHRTQFITMLRLLGKDPPFEAGDFGGWSNGK